MANHCIERAHERYGLALSIIDIRAFEAQIQDGRSVLVRRHDHGSEVHMVRHGPIVLLAVYGQHEESPQRQIVTFLPPDALQAGRHEAQYNVHKSVKRERRRKIRREGR